MPFFAVTLLIMLMWPFHHRPAPIAPPTDQSLTVTGPDGREELRIPESLCGHTEDGWDFLGPDSLIGVSTLSCQGAFENWNGQKTSLPKMNDI